MPRIDAFLQLGREQGASDVHFAIDSPPLIRHNGMLTPIKYRNLSREELASLLNEIISEKQQEQLDKAHGLDTSYTSEKCGRFRVSIYKKIGGLGAAFRIIPDEIPSLEQLGIPNTSYSLLNQRQGMILVTGATGTGKTTTLAAMIDTLNSNRKLNIVTLEDPIEFTHRSKKSLVIQREIGRHVDSYKSGLRAALREDPDVILIGELRDPETIMMAMTATETGHLVLGTLHTNTAAKTVDRIIDAVPTELKRQTKSFLAQHLKAVISQKLVRRFDGKGRTATTELPINTPAISNLILSGKVYQIPSVMQTGKDAGMQLFDQALMDALKQKRVDPDDAYLCALDKKAFQQYVSDPDLLPQANLALN